MRSDSLFRASIVTLGANLANRGLGFVREASLARLFGTGILLDKFVVAFAVPEYLTFIVFASLPIALLPTKQEVGNDPAKLSAFFWSGLSWIAGVYGLLGFAIFLWAGQILTLFGISADPDTIRLTQFLSSYPLINALEAYFRGWLYDARRFSIPALSSLALNVVFIAGLLFMPEADPMQLAWLHLMSSLVTMLINGVGALSIVRPVVVSFTSPQAITLLLRQWQIGIVEAVALCYPLVDRFFAARWLGEGEVAALRYAFLLVMLPSAILSYTASISAYPWVTAKSSPEKIAELRALYHSGVRLILFLVALAATGLLVFAQDCVAIAFQRGAFDARSLELTTEPVRWFALGLPCYAVVLFQMRFFYARSAIWLLLGMLLVMTVVKIAGSMIFAGSYGTTALALTTSIVWMLSFVLLGSKINGWIESSWRELLRPELPKILIVTAVVAGLWLTGSILWPSDGMDLGQRAIRLGLLGLGGIGVAVGMVHFLNVAEPKKMISRLRSRYPQ